METFEADSVHFLLLIDHGRARDASAWYQQAFGAQVLHVESSISGVTNGLRIQSVIYLQLGPPGMGVVLELRDSDRPRQLNNSNSMCVLTSNKVPELIQVISNLAPQPEVDAQVVNECQLYHVNDPYGFRWIIQSLPMLPDNVIAHYPDLMPAAALKNVCLAHLLLLVPHPTAFSASKFYRRAFGTAILGPDLGSFENGAQRRVSKGSSIFLHHGLKRQLLEIRDSSQISKPQQPTSYSLCILYSTKYQNLVAQAIQAGALEIATEKSSDINLQLSKLVDDFGFAWIFGSVSLIPDILNETPEVNGGEHHGEA